MTPEEWDGEIAEQLLRDAEAVVSELMQILDEVADGFDSESFEASVTGDDHRLLRLAEDARTSASAGEYAPSEADYSFRIFVERGTDDRP